MKHLLWNILVAAYFLEVMGLDGTMDNIDDGVVNVSFSTHMVIVTSPSSSEVTSPNTNICKGPNEIWSACESNTCQKTCVNFGMKNISCSMDCIPGCICEKGHLRNSSGICVKPLECDSELCPGQNENYTDCISPCETCLRRGSYCETLDCMPGCTCKDGYYRNMDGHCVPEEECECPINEEYSQCLVPYPPETCEAIGIQMFCVTINTEDCRAGCRCQKNFKRNLHGHCIDIRDCEPLKCKANEEFNSCPEFPQCVDQRCVPYPEKSCSMTWDGICYPRCMCKEGFCKNDKGKCIKISCGEDPHAVWDICGDPCPATCIHPKGHPNCTDDCQDSGCRCKEGFVRGPKGKCILPGNCPKCNDSNEEYKCGSPCDVYCSTLGEECPMETNKCLNRCYCKLGFARNHKSICVPIDKCPPPPRCSGNERFDNCPGKEIQCKDTFVLNVVFKDPEICEPKCRCIPGYVRKPDGRCVLPEKCCSDPNAEVVLCRNNCPVGTCQRPDTPPCNKDCDIFPKGCQCREGYVQISETDSRCVAFSRCPRTRKTTVTEVN